VAVQEVRWDVGSTQPADSYTFFYGNGKAYHHRILLNLGIILAVKRV